MCVNNCAPMMIYELSQDDRPIACFRSEAEARYHVRYMPAGCYRLTEYEIEGEYWVRRYDVNLLCGLHR